MERPIRIVFVIASPADGEETEARLLAQSLDPAYSRIEVIACLPEDGTPGQTHARLEAIRVPVDRTPSHLSFEETVAYLASRLPAYDLVVSGQNVAPLHPALDRLHLRPPLIERGGPMHHARPIPLMVDIAAFDPAHRAATRAALGISGDTPLIGWAGRLDTDACVENFIDAAALVHTARPDAHFVVIGASSPEYADTLETRAKGLGGVLAVLDDRADVPDLLCALDILLWLSRRENMPHVIAEAGAAGLPVIATRDQGTEDQIVDEVSGLFVPHGDPAAVAAQILRLLADPGLGARIGSALRAKVRAEHSAAAVVPQWRALFAHVLAGRPPRAQPTGLFHSFLQGGFESSTHRRAHDRQRIDVITSSQHDVHAEHDYRELARHGIITVREGLRWHRIEREPERYDWSSMEGQHAAAQATGAEVIWDLLHYGWPDDIDIWTPDFVTRFAAFAAAAARHIGPAAPGKRRFYAPINEISFFAWAGGDAAYLNPFAQHRGHELKVQLTRAAICAMQAILAVDPAARFVHVDPVINIVCDPSRPQDAGIVEAHRLAQYQAWDMIAGEAWPQIGGRPELLDIVGVNFYHNNQWMHEGTTLAVGDALHRPFHEMLAETYGRYGRAIFVAETGIEGDARAGWLRHILAEVRTAIDLGVPVEGVCLYPVLDHHGWDDDRYCPNGLMNFSAIASERVSDPALAAVIDEYMGRKPI